MIALLFLDIRFIKKKENVVFSGPVTLLKPVYIVVWLTLTVIPLGSVECLGIDILPRR